jgi:uncharacterized membrane protein (DUF485 family)
MKDPIEAREQALRALARRRWRVATALTLGMLITYFGFVLSVAFAKDAMGTVLLPGLSVGIVLGAGVIVTAWVLTVLYAVWANRRYDTALDALVGGSAQEDGPPEDGASEDAASEDAAPEDAASEDGQRPLP